MLRCVSPPVTSLPSFIQRNLHLPLLINHDSPISDTNGSIHPRTNLTKPLTPLPIYNQHPPVTDSLPRQEGRLKSGVMGGKDNYATAVTLPPNTAASFPSSIRFIGLLKQPESDSRPASLELDERDVIWPTEFNPNDPFEPNSDPEPESYPVNFYPSSGGFSLSAVFAEDRGLTVRRPTRPLTGRIGSGPDLLGKSVPVNVPTWHGRRQWLDDALDDVEEREEEDEDDGEMVPPHVIVAKSHVMTFSVFEGVGRTLKGRDLRRVRNTVFRQTGFLD